MVQEISFRITSPVGFTYRYEIERPNSGGICFQVGLFIADEGVGIVRPCFFLSDRHNFDLYIRFLELTSSVVICAQ